MIPPSEVSPDDTPSPGPTNPGILRGSGLTAHAWWLETGPRTPEPRTADQPSVPAVENRDEWSDQDVHEAIGRLGPAGRSPGSRYPGSRSPAGRSSTAHPAARPSRTSDPTEGKDQPADQDDFVLGPTESPSNPPTGNPPPDHRAPKEQPRTPVNRLTKPATAIPLRQDDLASTSGHDHSRRVTPPSKPDTDELSRLASELSNVTKRPNPFTRPAKPLSKDQAKPDAIPKGFANPPGRSIARSSEPRQTPASTDPAPTRNASAPTPSTRKPTPSPDRRSGRPWWQPVLGLMMLATPPLLIWAYANFSHLIHTQPTPTEQQAPATPAEPATPGTIADEQQNRVPTVPDPEPLSPETQSNPEAQPAEVPDGSPTTHQPSSVDEPAEAELPLDDPNQDQNNNEQEPVEEAPVEEAPVEEEPIEEGPIVEDPPPLPPGLTPTPAPAPIRRAIPFDPENPTPLEEAEPSDPAGEPNPPESAPSEPTS